MADYTDGDVAQTGQPLDGRYLLPMFAWMRTHDPERAARTTTVLGAKDYLFAWLTGELLTDPSTATGYGCYGLAEGDWLRVRGQFTVKLSDFGIKVPAMAATKVNDAWTVKVSVFGKAPVAK